MTAALSPPPTRQSSQEQLLPFLLNPNSYPHRPRRVRLVQTHSSFVFIVPPFVYKVKKAVNFGFLDFSTLEKRRHFCEREVILNRRLAPTIYQGVVPIVRREGTFAFNGPGESVEYAVKMRKLSDACFLDRLVERGAVSRAEFRRIAAKLKSFYRAQHPTAEIEAWGRIDRLRISTDENFRQTEEFIGRTISRPAYEAIQDFTDEFYKRRADLFEARVRAGWIRDCHGDLHLEHIHITPRALNIYDCIEFNDRLRYVDVANDLAFLAMDLDYERRPDLGRAFMAEMAGSLGDDGMLRLLDFYKCYRAYVRGKVESLHGITRAAPEEERRASAERARRYFRLALNYTVTGPEPLVLMVMGRIASGKSTLARALGEELGWDVYSSDHLRKKMAGFPIYERSSEAARSHLYSLAMTRQTYQRLLSSAAEQVRKGQSIILDATFAQRAHRDLAAVTFRRRGIHFRFLEAQAGDDAVKRRLKAREAAADEVSDARFEDFQMLTSLYDPPRELAPPNCVGIRTNVPASETVCRALIGLIRAQLTASE